MIEQALAQLLKGVDEQAGDRDLVEDLLAIGDEVTAHLTDEDRAALTTDWLYDDQTPSRTSPASRCCSRGTTSSTPTSGRP